jgi:hypothetical protein
VGGVSTPLAASLLAAACGARDEAARPASVQPAVAQAVAIAMPRPGRARLDAAVRANEACEACHADVAAEWRGSLHQRADLEPAYRRAFEIEPLPFCRSCHAPEADPHREESASLAELGVGCVTCHLGADDDRVLAAPREGLVSERAPHPVVRDPRFAAVEACAGCHEFPFPGLRPAGPETLMQSTVREHASSAARDRPCAECHMPRLEGTRRAHGFVASRSPEVVRSAVDVRVERRGDLVRIELHPRVSGHAFPTGDLFRRVEIAIEALGPDRLVLAREQRYLARHFELSPGAVGRRLAHDDRVHDEPRVVAFSMPEHATRELAFRVAYQRVAHPLDAGSEHALVEGEIVLAEGILAPLP